MNLPGPQSNGRQTPQNKFYHKVLSTIQSDDKCPLWTHLGGGVAQSKQFCLFSFKNSSVQQNKFTKAMDARHHKINCTTRFCRLFNQTTNQTYKYLQEAWGVFRLYSSHINQWIWVSLPFEQVREEWTRCCQDHLMSLYLLTIFTSQGRISKLTLIPDSQMPLVKAEKPREWPKMDKNKIGSLKRYL